MATTKKASTKKAATKAPAKKTTAHKATSTSKAPVVAKTAKKRSASHKKSVAAKQMHSFRIERDQTEFTSFRITKQTVYWIILVAFIIFVQLWILKLQVEVTTLLDAQQTQLQNP